MKATPASFVWYELMTTDRAAAEAFYRAVVGWEMQPCDGGMPYTVASAGGRPAAGFMTLPEEARAAGMPPAWLGFVGVADVDAAADGIRQAGGAVHRAPEDLPGIGRFAVVADPQGAVFMLFRPDQAEEPVAPMTDGHVSWHELYATDWESAFAFYAGRFGWTKDQAMDMGPMGTYQLFAAGSLPIGGMMNRPAEMPVAAWLFYFGVPAIDAAVERVKANGGRILNGPMEVPGGAWIVQATDPQGAMFALVGMKR
ncbi:MAG TPA: VOC family protein [Microvirga sp.]|nr:VOC family protein [Microvirga sp.]